MKSEKISRIGFVSILSIAPSFLDRILIAPGTAPGNQTACVEHFEPDGGMPFPQSAFLPTSPRDCQA
jgi:hypothetical protein